MPCHTPKAHSPFSMSNKIPSHTYYWPTVDALNSQWMSSAKCLMINPEYEGDCLDTLLLSTHRVLTHLYLLLIWRLCTVQRAVLFWGSKYTSLITVTWVYCLQETTNMEASLFVFLYCFVAWRLGGWKWHASILPRKHD